MLHPMNINPESVQKIAKRWSDTPYYDSVEKRASNQWNNIINPILSKFDVDFNVILDLSVGHGRMTNIFLDISEKVIGVDVNQENIDFCHDRFRSDPRYKKTCFIRNNGLDLQGIADSSISFVICWDSMVHFDSDVIRNYLNEFYRVMNRNSYAFIHHSNFTRNYRENFQQNPHARNFMSKELFAHYANKEHLEVIHQEAIDWGIGERKVQKLDCLTLLRKP